MPRRHRFQNASSRSGAGNVFFWLFLIFVFAIVGIVLWKSAPAKPQRRVVVSPKPVAPAPTSSGRISSATPLHTFVSQPIATNVSSPKTNPARSAPPAAASANELLPPPTSVGHGGFPRAPRDPLEVQVALARRAISSGSIDGVMGAQTKAALTAFQLSTGLSGAGELDQPTRDALMLNFETLTNYVVTSNDLARRQPVSKTWLGKSQQSALDYESILELVAEKGHASPKLVQKLNPGVVWTNVVAGDSVIIPAAEYPPPRGRAASVVISLAARQLEVFDAETNLLAHFPCSIAARVEKRPAGELHVTAIAPNPDYTFNPEVFPESEEARQIKTKLILPPGPNNPVGTAWISLDKPGYGMHGTPNPEQVGRTESHGCFRLANWNADYLLKLVWVGMPVRVEP